MEKIILTQIIAYAQDPTYNLSEKDINSISNFLKIDVMLVKKHWLLCVLVVIKLDYITYAFKKFIKDNGMRKIRFHDLRHTCASLLLNKGKGKVTMNDIQEWLGHSDYKTTTNIYAHLDLSSKNLSLETLTDIIKIK